MVEVERIQRMTSTDAGKSKRRIGKILTVVGAVLGGLGSLAFLIKLKLTLTPEMREVLFYKGLFAASLSLIALGAWYGREGRRGIMSAEQQKELTSGAEDQLDVPKQERLQEEL
jgi:hypothetical protein